jgi:very-short-patch-repair endonuclease
MIAPFISGQHIDQLEYDQARTLFLQSKGYKVLRFWNDAIFKEKEAVLEVILKALTPTLSRE